MVKQTKSKNQLEKQLDKSRQKQINFFIKKDQERDAKDSMARQAALDKLGIPLAFGFDDHKQVYNFAQERAPFNKAPIKIIDASIDPPALTSYPEYPSQEFSSPPAFAVVKVAFKAARETVDLAASRDADRMSRAKAILHKNVKK